MVDTEVKRFARFVTAAAFMGYIGVTPSESSSGETVTRGSITKTGNSRVRTLVVEAPCCASKKPKQKAAFLATCPKDVPPEVSENA